LIISRNSLHARIYLWWYRKKYGVPKDGTTNLCPYMRAVFIWTPLRILFWDWITVFEFPTWENDAIRLPLNFIVIPVLLFAAAKLTGYVSFAGKTFLWIMCGFTVLIILALIVGTVIRDYSHHCTMEEYRRMMEPGYQPKPKTNRLKVLERVLTRIAFAVDEFICAIAAWEIWELLHQWLRSAHDNVCPPVDLQ
jgi:hypothetical protein